MLTEALKAFTSLAQAAGEVQEFKVPGDSPSRVHIVGPNGKIEVIDKAPPHRQMEMLTLADLVELAVTPFDEAAWGNRVIFYSIHQVTLVLDRANGYELATLKLPPTEEVKFFLARRGTPAIAVRELVEAVLTTLRKTRPPTDIEEFAAAIGKLNVTGGDDKSASANRTNSSLSRAVVETVRDPEKLPPDLQMFNVRPFAVPDLKFRAPVMCTLLPRTSDATWRLQPLEDSWLEFGLDAITHLVQLMAPAAEAKVPIYCGSWSVKAT